jgi:hypothetical protein
MVALLTVTEEDEVQILYLGPVYHIIGADAGARQLSHPYSGQGPYYIQCSLNSVVECCPDSTDVRGSNPLDCTNYQGSMQQ